MILLFSYFLISLQLDREQCLFFFILLASFVIKFLVLLLLNISLRRPVHFLLLLCLLEWISLWDLKINLELA